MVAVAIAMGIGLSAIAYGWYTDSILTEQISDVNKAISSQNDLLEKNRQADDASASQIAAMRSSIQSIEVKVTRLGSQLNSTGSSNPARLQQISAELENISATVKILSAKVDSLTPQIPQSILTVMRVSYSNATGTFTFVVNNTRTIVVYAQLYADMKGLACGDLGHYYSPMYTFKPSQNTTVTLDLHLPVYLTGCSGRYIDTIIVRFVSAPNIEVSPTSTFTVSPYYRLD